MAAQIENLWGEAIGVKEDMTLPKTILIHQANYLKKISRNSLRGEVIASNNPVIAYPSAKNHIMSSEASELVKKLLDPKIIVPAFNFDFYIKSPSANYQFKLLSISHNYELYPLTVHGYLEEQNFKASDEEEFKSILVQLFRSPKTQRVLNILTAEAKA